MIGLVERDLEPAEQTAATELLRRRKAGTIELVISDETRIELDRRRDARPELDVVYLLLADVPVLAEYEVPWPQVVRPAGRSQVIGPRVLEDPDIALLKEIVSGESDAKHLHQAIQNMADYFVTTDRGILSKAERIAFEFPIAVRTPAGLLEELFGPRSALS